MTKVISDGEALEIYRKTLERSVAAKYATELTVAMPDQQKEIRQRIQQETTSEFQAYVKKRKSSFGLF